MHCKSNFAATMLLITWKIGTLHASHIEEKRDANHWRRDLVLHQNEISGRNFRMRRDLLCDVIKCMITYHGPRNTLQLRRSKFRLTSMDSLQCRSLLQCSAADHPSNYSTTSLCSHLRSMFHQTMFWTGAC